MPKAKDSTPPDDNLADAAARPAPGAATPDTAGPPFEEAYARLETLVDEMERGDLPLEALLSRFEEGVGLVKTCQAFLKQAQLRVEQFVELKDGQWVLKDMD